MTVTPIQLTALPADKSTAGPARGGKDGNARFADLLVGSRDKTGAASPNAKAAATATPDASVPAPAAGKHPAGKHALAKDKRTDDDATGLAMLTPLIAPTTQANINGGTSATTTPGTKKAPNPLIALATRTTSNIAAQTSEAALPADARAASVAARLSDAALRKGAAKPDRPGSHANTSSAAAQLHNAEQLLPTGHKPPAIDPGTKLIVATDNLGAMRHAMDRLATGAARKTEEEPLSKVDAPAIPTHSPALHTGVSGTGTPAMAPVPQAGPALNMPVGDDAWNQALVQQSLRLHHAGAGRAELQLHPKDLGTLQISLQMGDQAQIHISSAHAHVRAAVEAALPQLRRAFADSGIALGDTSVGNQSAQQQQHDSNQRRRGALAPVAGDGGAERAVIPVDNTNVALVSRLGPGGVDIFA